MKLMLMTLIVAKVAFASPEPGLGEVREAFDRLDIAWNTIGCANWADFPYKPEVQFRIMHSETEIYLQFHVRENGARATYGCDAGSLPYKDDCVEFFMIPSDRDGSYFNLEMNCIGHGTFHYGPDRNTRYHCGDDIVSQIRRESTLGSEPFGTREGSQEWTLTIAVPKRLYAQTDLDLTNFSGRTVKANFYKCGDDTAVPHYLSYFPVGTPRPNFHAPEFFGDITFE
ncbi:MAG: hypothetical protein K6G79_06205 [Bacteroidales bacterium]|nr:hypothetical protein [Bacteroidales bacterium]